MEQSDYLGEVNLFEIHAFPPTSDFLSLIRSRGVEIDKGLDPERVEDLPEVRLAGIRRVLCGRNRGGQTLGKLNRNCAVPA
ncbi:hypothetical protein J2Y46_002372 [Microbacterium sp. BE35]|uniref:hypothetical protein n=1 Tax=Microbacterium sp. BE35 TaxID=2817773 RepID=UPI00285B9E70|nr:hypothetical protein [Microbacterium sp. BE35]MDR7189546.1 hypothetical protein [Microbacterium sp. BE35]